MCGCHLAVFNAGSDDNRKVFSDEPKKKSDLIWTTSIVSAFIDECTFTVLSLVAYTQCLVSVICEFRWIFDSVKLRSWTQNHP